MKTVMMADNGRMTLPAEARQRLRLRGEAEFEVEVDEAGDALILRPVIVVLREDAWAYTPEHRELLVHAHADSREGRVHRLTESELTELAD